MRMSAAVLVMVGLRRPSRTCCLTQGELLPTVDESNRYAGKCSQMTGGAPHDEPHASRNAYLRAQGTRTPHCHEAVHIARQILPRGQHLRGAPGPATLIVESARAW